MRSVPSNNLPALSNLLQGTSEKQIQSSDDMLLSSLLLNVHPSWAWSHHGSLTPHWQRNAPHCCMPSYATVAPISSSSASSHHLNDNVVYTSNNSFACVYCAYSDPCSRTFRQLSVMLMEKQSAFKVAWTYIPSVFFTSVCFLFIHG